MNLSSMIPELLSALPLTLGIMFVAMIVGFFLALIATFFRVRRIPVISQLADLYVSYARSVPVVLQLFVAFYGMPLITDNFGFGDFFTANVAAMIGLSLYHGGYLSEVMRPAYLAVERGQHDATDSLGWLPPENAACHRPAGGALCAAGLRQCDYLSDSQRSAGDVHRCGRCDGDRAPDYGTRLQPVSVRHLSGVGRALFTAVRCGVAGYPLL